MPTYQYRCQQCGHELEQMQKMTDKPLEVCPSCHQSALKRGPGGGIGLSFSGPGFYVNDYGSNSQSTDKPTQDSGGGCCPCGKNKPCS